MKQLWEFGYAIRALQARMRFGELSRAPLQFAHLEWKSGSAECYWILRQPDPWDLDLPADIQVSHESLQALKDAIVIREILFLALPEVRRATLRAYRVSSREPRELIITGDVTRENEAIPSSVSVAMRAKLLGFHFCMEGGVLEALPESDQLTEVAVYEWT